MMKKAVIFRVHNAAAKLSKICDTAQSHFESKEALLFYLPTQEAAAYVDQLLWRQPEESFLPHTIAAAPTTDLISITTIAENVNQAKVAFNLQLEASDFLFQFDLIYDLLDMTHPDKEQQAHARIAKYKAMNYIVEF